MKELYPLYFRPVYKDYVWGGRKIIETFKRPNVPGIIAESWEIADHHDGMSLVENGAYQGLSLRDLDELLGEDLLGKGETGPFPLLIKLIDSHAPLSIQVHPDDASAKRLHSEAKTEMWYVLDADEGASVLAGFNRDMTKELFEKAVQENTLPDYIHNIPVKRGDAIYIPGGTIHAIMKGALLLEVQQNSNTTYRVYDWGRGRELHLEEAKEVLHFEKRKELLAKREGKIVTSPYFQVEKGKGSWQADSIDSFQIFFVLEGKGEIETEDGKEDCFPGRTFLIPAGAKNIRIHSPKDPFTFLRIARPRQG